MFLTRFAVPALLMLACAGSAQAGMLTANFSDPGGIRLVHFNTSFVTDEVNGASAAIVPATRTDLPAGPGVDTLIPAEFRVFCVEIGQPIYVPAASTFADVVLLSTHPTTNPGIFTGPVTFNEPRVSYIEKLFGTFYPPPLDTAANDAFQLALWELAFDDDLTLAPGGRVWVDSTNNPNPDVTNAAQGFLDAIRTDTGDVLGRATLALLTDPTVQDQLALIPLEGSGVPEPTSLALLGLGTVALLRRKK